MDNLFTEDVVVDDALPEVSESIIGQIEGSLDVTSSAVPAGTVPVDEVLEEIRTLNESEGNLRWRIADLVSLLTSGITSSKDKNRVIDYIANETNIEAVTVRQYDWMARAFPEGPIREISPFLTWSHYRSVAGFPSLEERREWLETAADNTWSVTKLKEEIAQSKESEAVKIGIPCSRIGCTCTVSEEPNERVIVNVYGYKLICCSASCATNVLINGLNKIRARILGDVEPGDGLTPLLAHPNPSQRETMSQSDFESLRNMTERTFFAEKQAEAKREFRR